MTLRKFIDKAGKFPVVQTPCPFFSSQLVDLDAPPAGILHTTEGAWNPSMGVFRVHYAPHFIVGLNPQGQAEIAQLVPVGVIGAACRAHNNKARVEIEMVGKSLETLWQPDPATMDALASLMVVCRDEWEIPLFHPWPVGDYGRAGHNAHRSSGKYGSVAGWFGHADMPDPDTHWDPGNFNWPAVFARAAVLSSPESPQQELPLTPQSEIRDVFWLQASLNELGASPALQVDGDLGKLTKAALMPFQFNHHLKVSGEMDAATVAAVETALKAKG